jgi:hypothetical protein
MYKLHPKTNFLGPFIKTEVLYKKQTSLGIGGEKNNSHEFD